MLKLFWNKRKKDQDQVKQKRLDYLQVHQILNPNYEYVYATIINLPTLVSNLN